jgi:hypothetical protein
VTLVSVVMAVRDGEPHLDEAVRSVLEQSHTELELVVVDDGSRDRTPQLLGAWARRDARLRVVEQPPTGFVVALQRGVSASRGPLIARMDADDVALPRRLQLQVAALDARPALGLVGCWYSYINSAGVPFRTNTVPTQHSELIEALSTTNPFCHPSVVMRRSAYNDVGGYRLSFDTAEDYDLWLRMSERWEIANVPEVGLLYRVHPQQVSATRTAQMARTTVLARAAAAARATAGQEPELTDAAAEEQLLATAGYTSDDLQRLVLDFHLWYARTTFRAGYHRRARTMWRQAWQAAGRCRPRAPARGAVLRDVAGTRRGRAAALGWMAAAVVLESKGVDRS